ncbi:MAG: Y-family DNA polymerase [Candidatus Paceibacterota bacterium]
MKKDAYVALIDCNNFFVSCERIFRPELLRKPVAVLSNNDGCIVARSNEVKALGIPMGIPYFQVKETLKKENVTIFSGNFSLYGDISKRIMSIIESFVDDIEIYSIDEAFVFLDSDEGRSKKRAEAIKEAIETGTGVPVSIGIAQTKTLSKLAGEYAKKDPANKRVFVITEENRERLLEDNDISEVWGVGAQTSIKLREYGVTTPLALVNSSDQWIRATLGIGGLRMAEELRGKKRLIRDPHAQHKKSILSSRSFGKKTSEYKNLTEAVATHVTNVARKMRRQGDGAGFISVFVRSARSGGARGVTSSGFRVLLSPTTDTFALIHHAFDILSEIYKEGVVYEKAGALLSGLTPIEHIPASSLFSDAKESNREKLMQTIDSIERKHGKNILFSAALGIQGKQAWQIRNQFSSGSVTTDWSSLPVVKTG